MLCPTLIFLDNKKNIHRQKRYSKFLTLLRYETGNACVLLKADSELSYSKVCTKFGTLLTVGESSARNVLETIGLSASDWKEFSQDVCEVAGDWIAVTQQENSFHIHLPLLSRFPLFWSESPSDTVASTSLEYLVESGAQLDLCDLTLRTLPLGPLWPFSRQTIWTGIRRLSVAERLDITGVRRQASRVWTGIVPKYDRKDIVSVLANELPLTVARLCENSTHVGVDCSGGLDSTAVAYLAYSKGLEIDAYHVAPADPANEDSVWAMKVISEIGATPVISHNRSVSSFFVSSAQEQPFDPEGPFVWSAGYSHLNAVATRNRLREINVQLTGFGGDELFTPMPAQLWSCVRENKIRGLGKIRRSAKLNRVPVTNLISEALRSTPFHEAFSNCLAQNVNTYGVDLSWGVRLRPAKWITRDALNEVQKQVCHLAELEIAPLSIDRSIHQQLLSLSYEVELLRQITRNFGFGELTWRSPFLEREIVIPTLGLSSFDRLNDGRTKLLLRDVTRGIVPDTVFNRIGKGDYSRELFNAIALQREHLRSYFSYCRLADVGIVDADKLLAAIDSGINSTDELHALQSTLETERWLRCL